ELVKSLGLAEQEVTRLNTATGRILGLELKKVRYLRGLSFLQGTSVNLMRTSLLFVMLYLIFAHDITVGQVFSLLMYSCFIFGPLQQLGEVVQIYREAEVSLQRFQTLLEMPPEPRPEHAVRLPALSELEFANVGFQHQSAKVPALVDISFALHR